MFHREPSRDITLALGGTAVALSKIDRYLDDDALVHGDRILSAYETAAGVRFWLITEADRSATTALLPDEY